MKIRFWHLVVIIVAGSAWPAAAAWAGEPLSFVPSWEGRWQASAKGDVCTLSTTVAEYGEVRFVGGTRRALSFELQAHRDLFAGEDVAVSVVAPGWHPLAPHREVLGSAVHVRGGGAVASTTLAQRMLWSLRSGLRVEVGSPAWFADGLGVRVIVPPTYLHPALESFLECAQTDVSVAWGDVSRTRVMYSVDAHALADAARERLRAVARYALSDLQVRKIYVDGHTDASGAERHNARLSRRRAETVAGFLREAIAAVGEDGRKIDVVVRYHGARYPIAANDDAVGRAQNRRTTVRLARVGETRTAAR